MNPCPQHQGHGAPSMTVWTRKLCVSQSGTGLDEARRCLLWSNGGTLPASTEAAGKELGLGGSTPGEADPSFASEQGLSTHAVTPTAGAGGPQRGLYAEAPAFHAERSAEI